MIHFPQKLKADADRIFDKWTLICVYQMHFNMNDQLVQDCQENIFSYGCLLYWCPLQNQIYFDQESLLRRLYGWSHTPERFWDKPKMRLRNNQ